MPVYKNQDNGTWYVSVYYKDWENNQLSVALKLSVTHKSGKENFSQSKQATLV